MNEKENWREWFKKQVKDSGMQVKQMPLTAVSGWSMQDSGDFGRPDGKFFKFTGVRVSMTKDQREIGSWDQPLIEEFGEGAVVVLKARNQDLFLLQAKLEPGNDSKRGYLMLNAPLSSSKSNLLAVHGGKRPPRAELLDDSIDLIAIPQDGGKFLGKTNFYGYQAVDPDSIELNANERWFSREEIREALAEGLITEHLSQALLTYFL